MTDTELLEYIYQDDITGLTLLIDIYADLVYKIVSDVLLAVGSEDDIEECVSDAFVAFYDNIDDVDLTRGNIKGYLGVIAGRRAVNLYHTLTPDDDTTFDEYTVEEMSEMLANEEVQLSSEISEAIKRLCFKEIAPEVLTEEPEEEITEETTQEIADEITVKNVSRFGMVLKTVVAMVTLVVVIAGAVIAFDRLSVPKHEPTTTTTTITQPTTQEEPYNPLLSAILSGNEKLIEELITNSLLLSQDVLQFAIEYADKISYDSIRRIAEEVRNKYGSTGLDPILEGAIFGDFQSVTDKLRDKDESEMTPAEKLAFFFATTFGGEEG